MLKRTRRTPLNVESLEDRIVLDASYSLVEIMAPPVRMTHYSFGEQMVMTQNGDAYISDYLLWDRNNEDVFPREGGGVYHFDVNESSFFPVTTPITPNDPELGVRFGSSMEGDGDLLIVGGHGRVRIIDTASNQLVGDIKPPINASSNFGRSLGIHEDANMAYVADFSNDEVGGLVYAYSLDNLSTPVKTYQSPTPELTEFGNRIAPVRNGVVISHDPYKALKNRVYLFPDNGDAIDLVVPEEFDFSVNLFGTDAVRYDDTRVLVSAPGGLQAREYLGMVHVYNTDTGEHMGVLRVDHPTGTRNDGFGYALGTDGKSIIFGAPGHSYPGVLEGGAVWIFPDIDSADPMMLENPDLERISRFGHAVAINGQNALVTLARENRVVHFGSAIDTPSGVYDWTAIHGHSDYDVRLTFDVTTTDTYSLQIVNGGLKENSFISLNGLHRIMFDESTTVEVGTLEAGTNHLLISGLDTVGVNRNVDFRLSSESGNQMQIKTTFVTQPPTDKVSGVLKIDDVDTVFEDSLSLAQLLAPSIEGLVPVDAASVYSASAIMGSRNHRVSVPSSSSSNKVYAITRMEGDDISLQYHFLGSGGWLDGTVNLSMIDDYYTPTTITYDHLLMNWSDVEREGTHWRAVVDADLDSIAPTTGTFWHDGKRSVFNAGSAFVPSKAQVHVLSDVTDTDAEPWYQFVGTWGTNGTRGPIIPSAVTTLPLGKDTDLDGVYDFIEDAGPNSGNINADRLLDSQQASVASLPNAETGEYEAIVSYSRYPLTNVKAFPAYGSPIGEVNFDIGAVSEGRRTTVRHLIPEGTVVSGYDMNGESFVYDAATDTGALFQGNRVALRLLGNSETMSITVSPTLSTIDPNSDVTVTPGVMVQDAQLSIVGDSGDNSLQITKYGSRIFVTPLGGTTVNGQQGIYSFDRDLAAWGYQTDLGGGNDVITFYGTSIPRGQFIFDSGDGNDEVNLVRMWGRFYSRIKTGNGSDLLLTRSTYFSWIHYVNMGPEKEEDQVKLINTRVTGYWFHTGPEIDLIGWSSINEKRFRIRNHPRR